MEERKAVALSWVTEKGQSEEVTATAKANAEKEPATPRPGERGQRQREQRLVHCRGSRPLMCLRFLAG